MNLLIVRGIAPVETLPDFGAAFHAHMSEKKHPQLAMASAFAWKLLAEGMEKLGLPLREVAFSPSGKPCFIGAEEVPGLSCTENALCSGGSSASGLYFSLSHSGSMAAALICDHPCGVDIEQTRREVSDKLYGRCMHPAEIAAGMDFFEAWTKKECIAKLGGSGLPSHPCEINTLAYDNWFIRRLRDSMGNEYWLSALCSGEMPSLSF